MKLTPGTRFSVKNPYSLSTSESKYEVIRIQENVCFCLDLGTRFTIAMPVAYVKSKISSIKTKNKL